MNMTNQQLMKMILEESEIISDKIKRLGVSRRNGKNSTLTT